MKEKVTIIGLGYVGLPLACQVAKKGYETFGLDVDKKTVNLVNKKKSPFQDEFVEKLLPKVKIQAGTDPKVLLETDIAIICVPTPVDKKNMPVFTPLIKAVEAIADNLNKGMLIVVESTINPGVSEEVVLPIFEKKGYEVGKDFFLAHCPERINPGDPKWNVTNIPRCLGTITDKGLRKALKFYRSVIDASITPMKSIKEAEATKTIENAFRDINIAFVNELAKSFDKMGIDLIDVIRGASSKPFAFMPHWPSRGVGGHCIPVDPYYLIEKAKQVGFQHDFLKLARRINLSMPEYTVKLLEQELNEIKKSIKGTRIGILGVSYKRDIDDTRDAPFYHILKELKERKAKVEVFDPFIPSESTVPDLKTLLKKAGAVILATDHTSFGKITPGILEKNGVEVLIDGMNFLDKDAFLKSKVRYKGIGR